MRFRSTVPRWHGYTQDRRCTVWWVMCPMCGREWSPEPVPHPIQTLHCRDCRSELLANYDAPEVILAIPGEL